MDRREQILARLYTVLQTVEPLTGLTLSFWRNRGELPEDKRPAITMLDADEQVGTQVLHGRGQGGLAAQPVLVTMRPEIFILLDAREPHNKDAGQDLNVLRIRVLKAVNNDVELATLVTTLVYEGCLSDLATGRSMTGQMQIQFAFTYPFKASEFAA